MDDLLKDAFMQTLYKIDLHHNKKYEYGHLYFDPSLSVNGVTISTEPTWYADFWGVMQINAHDEAQKPNRIQRFFLRYLLGITIR